MQVVVKSPGRGAAPSWPRAGRGNKTDRWLQYKQIDVPQMQPSATITHSRSLRRLYTGRPAGRLACQLGPFGRVEQLAGGGGRRTFLYARRDIKRARGAACPAGGRVLRGSPGGRRMANGEWPSASSPAGLERRAWRESRRAGGECASLGEFLATERRPVGSQLAGQMRIISADYRARAPRKPTSWQAGSPLSGNEFNGI